MLLAFISLSGSKNSLECTPGSTECNVPELIYKFPAVYIHTFLESYVDKESYEGEGLKIKYDEENPQKVKDLIWINTDDSMKVVENFRAKYNKEIPQEVHDAYKKFSNERYTESTLLKIYPDTSGEKLPSLDSPAVFGNNNYYFHIKTSKGTHTMIFFKQLDARFGHDD